MHIQLDNLGRRFNRSWIFRSLSTEIKAGSHLIIQGANGSGKSTLTQILSGFLSPSEGKISWLSSDNLPIQAEDLPFKLSFAAPYQDLYQDLSLMEILEFHLAFRSLLPGINKSDFIDLIYLKGEEDKLIKHFSSGMKQRLKLGLAILSEGDLLLLDEPISNLDKQASAWYRELLQDYGKEKTVIISTNDPDNESIRQDQLIKIEDYK
ncbi:MAG: ATP-binding cassette domain-containing protein [Flavobacteriales bacterium]|jgi:ABC-type multidrug transport system ATPase subunit|nr:ATP-binding cassette domain-containing protein [Flavobacteriales bacterium]